MFFLGFLGFFGFLWGARGPALVFSLCSCVSRPAFPGGVMDGGLSGWPYASGSRSSCKSTMCMVQLPAHLAPQNERYHGATGDVRRNGNGWGPCNRTRNAHQSHGIYRTHEPAPLGPVVAASAPGHMAWTWLVQAHTETGQEKWATITSFGGIKDVMTS